MALISGPMGKTKDVGEGIVERHQGGTAKLMNGKVNLRGRKSIM